MHGGEVNRLRDTPAIRRWAVEKWLPLLPMSVMLLWSLPFWKRLVVGPPIVWTWRLVATLSLAILGVVAVPFLVVIGLRLL
jgi:hypothetical protein